jgi:hypothetical protein
MADHLQLRGSVSVDDGASRKLLQEGKSLLPIGMTSVSGDFARGDVIAVRDSSGQEIARGLANYASAEDRLLCRKPSSELKRCWATQRSRKWSTGTTWCSRAECGDCTRQSKPPGCSDFRVRTMLLAERLTARSLQTPARDKASAWRDAAEPYIGCHSLPLKTDHPPVAL